jgi:hypothetical protein
MTASTVWLFSLRRWLHHPSIPMHITDVDIPSESASRPVAGLAVSDYLLIKYRSFPNTEVKW